MRSRPPENRASKGDDRQIIVERKCYTCDYWRPHAHYPFIGLCTLHNRFTLDNDACEDWKPLKINEGRFYWCSTCKTRITGEEAKVLLAKGNRVHRGAYIDPDIREELYSVF